MSESQEIPPALSTGACLVVMHCRIIDSVHLGCVDSFMMPQATRVQHTQLAQPTRLAHTSRKPYQRSRDRYILSISAETYRNMGRNIRCLAQELRFADA